MHPPTAPEEVRLCGRRAVGPYRLGTWGIRSKARWEMHASSGDFPISPRLRRATLGTVGAGAELIFLFFNRDPQPRAVAKECDVSNAQPAPGPGGKASI